MKLNENEQDQQPTVTVSSKVGPVPKSKCQDLLAEE